MTKVIVEHLGRQPDDAVVSVSRITRPMLYKDG
jgi:hypothetical protein